ncbi:MAG TPA: hypothetical protein VGO57_17720 [Verrucomicrobiae bacterium]
MNQISNEPQFSMVDHANGSRTFVLLARRNFSEKISFSICLLAIGGFLAGIEYALHQFAELPAWLNFLTIGWVKNSLEAILVPVVVLLSWAVLNLWLRVNWILVRPGELKVITRWLFLKRTQIVPLAKIMETRLENNSSDGGILYYDLVVIAIPDKPGRLRIDTDPETRGIRVVAATDIKGKADADQLLQKINEILLR